MKSSLLLLGERIKIELKPYRYALDLKALLKNLDFFLTFILKNIISG